MDNEQLKKGYKRTEVGIIPNDWDVKKLSSALKTKPQYGINAPAVTYDGNLPIYIRITDISEHGYFAPETIVAVDHKNSNQFYLEEGDIVFARTGASVGKSYLYNMLDGKLVYAGFLIKIRPDHNQLIADFLAQYVKTKAYWSWVKIMSMRSGQPGINGNEFGQLLIPFPKIKEQRTIAGALSDVDALIAALDKLIAKKRAIKTATMQQLLTGKKRLPGFEGGRVKKPIGDFAPLQRGFDLPTSQLIGGQYPVVYSNGVMNKHSDYMVRGPGVVTGRSGTLGKVHYIEDNYWPHNTSLWVTDFKNNQPKFVYYLYSFIGFERFASGSGVPTLNRNDAHAFIVEVPESSEEQISIANILSDMDIEITALEARRNKTQSIKQGMMQELLTGRIRLV